MHPETFLGLRVGDFFCSPEVRWLHVAGIAVTNLVMARLRATWFLGQI